MTMQHATDERLSFDMADRLRRALRVSGVSAQEMAAELDVSRNTISNWINGRAVPRRRDLRDFALKTGFPMEWLSEGASMGNGLGPEGGTTSEVPEIGGKLRFGNLRPVVSIPGQAWIASEELDAA